MSAKEVSELRKSGQLEAAYVIAEHDLNIHADDFSRNAMFWVIRDMMNVACQNGDMVNAKKMFSKMKALVGDMVIVDSYVSNSIKFAEMKLCPNANVIDEANRLVKNGQLEEAYNKLKKEVQHPIEDILHEKYGWIICFRMSARLKHANYFLSICNYTTNDLLCFIPKCSIWRRRYRKCILTSSS